MFTGSIDAVNRYFADCNWSDGLAIVPPTVERIEEFLKYTGYSPDEEIAVLPSANLRATPWNIAANGVMAGCRPEHLRRLCSRAGQRLWEPGRSQLVDDRGQHPFVSSISIS